MSLPSTSQRMGSLYVLNLVKLNLFFSVPSRGFLQGEEGVGKTGKRRVSPLDSESLRVDPGATTKRKVPTPTTTVSPSP